MSDYSDFMRHFGMSGQRAAELYDLFNQYYDKQHGSKRWWLSNTPPGLIRRLEDKAKKYDDAYQNSGRDPVYSDYYDTSLARTAASAAGSVVGLPRMARSISALYLPEVVENVGPSKRFRHR